jgi:DNA mismatch endonuclease (patch repair protein)
MAQIRQYGTGAELRVREIARGLKLSYRLNNRDLPGSPDLANRIKRWALFVHGCFWHRHARCVRATTPKRNASFWKDKFLANMQRDRRVQRELKGMGYRVLVLWECEIEQRPDVVQTKLRELLRGLL